MNNIFLWIINKFNDHRVSVHAAQVAFFIIVSFFPFLMFLITVLQYTPLSEDVLMSATQSLIPGELSTVVLSWLNETYEAASGTILSVTAVTALWAGSKGFSGIAYELDSICEVKDKRSVIRMRLLSLLYTVVFTLMIILSLAVLVYGNQIVQMINEYFPFLSKLKMIFFILRSAVSFLIFILYFLCLYRFVPNRATRLRDELPGAGLAAFLWIAFSYLYSLYVDYYSSFSSLYGSLTHIVFLMLWLYFCIIILFLGALLNQFLKKNKRLNLLKSIKEIPDLLRSFLENKR